MGPGTPRLRVGRHTGSAVSGVGRDRAQGSGGRDGSAGRRLGGQQGFDASTYYRQTPASRDPRVSFVFEGIDKDELIGDFGTQRGGAAGLEIDYYDRLLGSPSHALVVASSENHSNVFEMVNEAVLVAHGQTDAAQNPGVRADMVFFETPNGGAVFDGVDRLPGQPPLRRVPEQRGPAHDERAPSVRRPGAVPDAARPPQA